jgi:hypothetical protein
MNEPDLYAATIRGMLSAMTKSGAADALPFASALSDIVYSSLNRRNGGQPTACGIASKRS